VAEKAVMDAQKALDDLTPTSSRDDLEAAGDAIDDAREEVGKLAYAERGPHTEVLDALAARLDLADRLDATDKIAEANRLADMVSADSIADTKAAIEMAKAAIDRLPDDDQAHYDAQLSDADMQLFAAEEARDAMELESRKMAQNTDLTNAAARLRVAVAALTGASDEAAADQLKELVDEAATALAALNAAIEGAVDLEDAAKAPYSRQAADAGPAVASATGRYNQKRTAEDNAKNTKRADAAKKIFATMSEAHGYAFLRSSADNDAAVTAIAGVKADGDRVSSGGFRYQERHDRDDDGKTLRHGFVYDTKERQPLIRYEEATDELKPAPGVFGTTGETVAEHVSGSGFGTTGDPKLHKPADGEDTVSVPGTWREAVGKYTCTVTGDVQSTCTSRSRTDGGIVLASGNGSTWTFTPGINAMIRPDDKHYTQFGWWLDDAAAADADATATIRAFVKEVRPTDVTATASINSRTGSATYKGVAAGKAVVYEPAEPGTRLGGAFTATATLTADFDAGSGNNGQIAGTVDDFKVNTDGEMVPVKWSVALPASDLSDAGAWGEGTGARSPRKTIWTINGTSAPPAGGWAGALTEQGDQIGGQEPIPPVAAGGFSAGYGHVGHMVGAFGARKSE